MPPKTSWSDVTLLFGVVIVVGVAHWFARRLIRRKPETLERTFKDVRGNIPIEDLERIAILFNRSLANLLLCITPFLGFWFGNTCASLLRDQGYIIFPWIIMIGPGLMAILMFACERIRLQLLKKEVARKTVDSCGLTAASISTVQSLSYDENPYSPPKC